jgi:hypothetical protein
MSQEQKDAFTPRVLNLAPLAVQLQNCVEWNMKMRDSHMLKVQPSETGMARSTVREHMRCVHRHQRNIDRLNAQLRGDIK